MLREMPRRGWALVAETVTLTAGATAVGAAATFLALAAFGFLVEEGFRATFSEAGWDPILRVGVGVTAVVIVLALVASVLFLCVSRLATAEQLARAADEDPRTVAAWSTRRVVELRDPFGALTIVAVVVLPIAALGVLVIALALGESFRHDAEGTDGAVAALAAFVVLGGILILALVLRRRSWTPRWDAATSRTSAAWRSRAPAAVPGSAPARLAPVERLLRATRRLGLRVGAWMLGVSVVVTLVTLYLRQPCRLCDTRQHADPGEALIDVLAQAGALGLGVSVALILVAGLAGGIARLLIVARLTRLAGDPSRPAPDAAAIGVAFRPFWPLQEVGLVAAGIGGGGVPLVIAVGLATGAPPIAALVLAALGIAGAFVLAAAEGSAARARTRMRDAWSLGDVRPAPKGPSDSDPGSTWGADDFDSAGGDADGG